MSASDLRHLRVVEVKGDRGFRRRLLEMGLVPGVEFKVVSIAPLGDPWQIEIRGGRWSLRRAEAEQLVVDDVSSPTK